MLALEIAAGIVLGGLTLVYWRTILFVFWFVVGLALTFGASAFVAWLLHRGDFGPSDLLWGLLGTAGCYAGSGYLLIKDDVNPRMGWICLLTGGAFGAAWLFIHNAIS